MTTGDEPKSACEDCGGRVFVGPEPVEPTGRNVDGEETQLVDFCTNPGCPSNHLRGLTRLDVNLWECVVCGERLRGSMRETFQHRRTH